MATVLVEFRDPIVACVRCDDLSSALRQSRPVSARYYLVAMLSYRQLPAQTAGVARRARLNDGRGRYSGPATQTGAVGVRQWHWW